MTSRRTWFTRMAAAVGLSPLVAAEPTKPNPIPRKVSHLFLTVGSGGSYADYSMGALDSGSCIMHVRLLPGEFGVVGGYVTILNSSMRIMRIGTVTACLDDGSQINLEPYGKVWRFPETGTNSNIKAVSKGA